MHPPLNIAAALACPHLLALSKAWNGCRNARQARLEAPAAPRDTSCQPHAKHFAAAVFGWGKWEGPSVRVDAPDLLDEEPVAGGAE